ncbi:MAG TPA: DUF937 domain-containing protein [Gemmatimonadaceae bacterium]|nr:DUF937 domain-containing protein [Gemmatimonadaceae bacterium]
MSGILDTVRQQLTPETIGQIGQQLGMDEATTRQAIAGALPVVLGGMAGRADDPANAAAMAAESDNYGAALGGLGGLIPGSDSSGSGSSGGVLGGLGSILGGGGLGGILGNVLGSSDKVVEDGVSQASGLDSPRAKQLMMILVPLVLAGIARRKSSQGLDPAQVGPELRSDAQSAQAYAERKAPQMGGLLGAIMGQVMQKPK